MAERSLRTGRRLSHVFRFDVPRYDKPLLLTDAALNIHPTLEDKADIVRNAITLAHALGVERPNVAILAAVEMINVKMQSTLDAAALCKMADRGVRLDDAANRGAGGSSVEVWVVPADEGRVAAGDAVRLIGG